MHENMRMREEKYCQLNLILFSFLLHSTNQYVPATRETKLNGNPPLSQTGFKQQLQSQQALLGVVIMPTYGVFIDTGSKTAYGSTSEFYGFPNNLPGS